VEHESPPPLLLPLPLALLLLPPLLLLLLLPPLELPELLEPEPDDPPEDEPPGPTPFVFPPHAPAAADKRRNAGTRSVRPDKDKGAMLGGPTLHAACRHGVSKFAAQTCARSVQRTPRMSRGGVCKSTAQFRPPSMVMHSMDPAMPREPAHVAREYVEAVGDKELGKVEALLAQDVEYTGPATTLSSAADVLTALRRIGAIHVRNEIRRVFVDGDEACVIYDFVTDTAIGTVPTVEWLRIERGRIRSVRLYYDRAPWLASPMAQGSA
jgi:hypothetical protein